MRKKASPVVRIDEHIKRLAADMIDTMHGENGIGLAAPQVGESIAMITVDISREEGEGEAVVLINPEIYESSGEATMEEGCLSLPDIREDIVRPEFIKVRCLNLEGKKVDFECGGLLARVIQHENDHLLGKLLIDYLGPLKRNLLKSKLRKISKGEIPARIS